MKGFLSVLRFELTNYFKNKGYLITTGIIAAVLIVGLSLPSFFDMSGLFLVVMIKRPNQVNLSVMKKRKTL